MTQIASQVNTFAPPQNGSIEMTQPGVATNIPIDGSASVVVPFLQPFAQVCNGVNIQYSPITPTGYILDAQPTALTVNGFTLTVFGGPVGATDNFFFTATGI